MRVLPAIVLIFLLSSTYGLPHSYGHTVNNQYSTIVMGNQTIGGMGYNSIFYSAGNITTSIDPSVVMDECKSVKFPLMLKELIPDTA